MKPYQTFSIIITAVCAVGCHNTTTSKNTSLSQISLSNNQSKMYTSNIDSIKQVYQLQDHLEEIEGDTTPLHIYSERDVNIALPLLAQGLRDSGFNEIDQKSFKNRLHEIFGDILKSENDKVRIRDKFLTVFAEKKSNEDLEFDYTIDNFFIPKEHSFITTVPFLGDFIEFVDSSHYTIKALQKFVALNKYLFNNSQPDLAYLLQEDSLLLKTLVTSFGYTKEPKINDLVMNDYFDMEDERKPTIGNIIFVKNALGVLEIKEELLKWIFRHTAAHDHQLLDALDKYANMLYDNRPNEIFTHQPYDLFTLNEKRKIVAYIAIVYEPLFHKFLGALNSNWPDFSVLERIIQKDPGLRDYIRQQHYYSLESLKKIIESSDYDL
ncbi:hypothetical protein FHW36_1011023 [Chitinophaga polysaccharea]|uniref:Uncharacterized protein n=1 Tax=Chitinophaga polysaccharea TaxID=1293035 RepID=A0A561Q411_9BACT|nr:hypothetical protein [Chitinophaga polysaccharea]TWF45097.1 hypothetical protein FHW36_1011023 [Chitinophaga polysaccharea]